MRESNIKIAAENNKTILLDYQYQTGATSMPVVIFSHGLKGFKDWGPWDVMGSSFAEAGFLFIKHNFSHNGGTPQQPIDFPDLEAFGNNNYSIEVRDLCRVIDWLLTSDLPYDPNKIALIGHSRGAGIATIAAANHNSISHLITLAGVADYESRFPKNEELKEWEKTGVYYVNNGRTGQQMPFYYQLYTDYLQNSKKLDIQRAAARLSVPHLIIHGTDDRTVDLKDAYIYHKNSPHSQLLLVQGADHVMGASHPWQSKLLPKHLRKVVQCAINFLKT